MAQEKITPEKIAEQLAGMVEILDQAQTPALEELAALQERRAERAQRQAKRLASTLPEDHPRLRSLRRSGDRANILRRNWQENATRAAKIPRIQRDEWMVYGHVQDAQGRPAPKLQVRLFAKEQQAEEVLKPGVTDEFGDFAMVYPASLLKRLGERNPELFLRVEDRRGRELFVSDIALSPSPGRAAFFLIELGGKSERG